MIENEENLLDQAKFAKVNGEKQMDPAKFLGKVASKLHASYTQQTTGTAANWAELPKEEKRVWIVLTRRAAGLLGSERLAPRLEAVGDPNVQAKDNAADEEVAQISGDAKDDATGEAKNAASGDMNDAASAVTKDDASKSEPKVT